MPCCAYAIPCRAVPCRAVPCCAYAMPCHVMPCYRLPQPRHEHVALLLHPTRRRRRLRWRWLCCCCCCCWCWWWWLRWRRRRGAGLALDGFASSLEHRRAPHHPPTPPPPDACDLHPSRSRTRRILPFTPLCVSRARSPLRCCSPGICRILSMPFFVVYRTLSLILAAPEVCEASAPAHFCSRLPTIESCACLEVRSYAMVCHAVLWRCCAVLCCAMVCRAML